MEISKKKDKQILSIRNLTVQLSGTSVLSNINVSVKGGQLTGILGPSGSGKTSLLNAIAGRNKIQCGEITLDNVPLTKTLRRKLGFVLQHDMFLPNLTLWETLHFAAMIRLPESLSYNEKLQVLENLIDVLNLRTCLRTVVGDIFKKGLSGGEKRRASIACELLIDPDILMLDEPTTGLDSSTAFSLMDILKNYSTRFNKIVASTIHQPSSQIYHLFDELILLSQGKVAYHGPGHEQPLYVFEELGLMCDQHMNPADFLADVLKSDQTVLDKAIRAVSTESEAKTDFRYIEQPLTQPGVYYIGTSMPGTVRACPTVSETFVKWPTGFWTQCRFQVRRSLKEAVPRIVYPKGCFIQIVDMTLICLLYFQIPDEAYSVRDRMGLLFLSNLVVFEPGIFHAMDMFLSEKEVINKERSKGWYRLSSYYLGKLFTIMPVQCLITTTMYTVIYWTTGVGTVKTFFSTLPVMLMSTIVGQSIGVILGSSMTDSKLAHSTGQAFLVFSILIDIAENKMLLSAICYFAGFYTWSLPWWLKWLPYLSVHTYTYKAAVRMVFADMENYPCASLGVISFPKCMDNITDEITAEDILHVGGITLPVYCYLGTVAIITVTLFALAYIVLRRNVAAPYQ